MTRYKLSQRVYTTLVGRGYHLICKICEKKLEVGDCIESKPNKYKNRKFYHCDCYQDSFIDLPDGDDDESENDEPE